MIWGQSMRKEIRKVIVFFMAAGCAGILHSATVQATGFMNEEMSFATAANQITLKNEYRAIDITKAEYMGMGRLYPFQTKDGNDMLYHFTTSAKRSYYQVKTLLTTGTAMQADIYDETGNVVAELLLGDTEYQRFSLETEKTYYIKIHSIEETAGSILVSEISDDYTGDWKEAKTISFGREYAVTTECEGDWDCLQFKTGTKDVYYTLKVDSTAGIAAEYEVLDESGEKIEEFSGVTSTEKKLSKKLVLESGKTYYLRFSSSKVNCQLLISLNETINKYKLTYHLNGGKNHKDNPSTYVATDKITLKAPSRKGYLFEGWYSFSDFTGKFSGIDGTAKKNYELYAKWKKVEPAAVSLKSFVSKSVGKATLEFHPVSECNDYQISITQKKNKKKTVIVQTTKKTKVAFKDWEQGEKYTVKVRAYIIDSCGNQIYGAYSKEKSVTVKKRNNVRKKA